MNSNEWNIKWKEKAIKMNINFIWLGSINVKWFNQINQWMNDEIRNQWNQSFQTNLNNQSSITNQINQQSQVRVSEWVKVWVRWWDLIHHHHPTKLETNKQTNQLMIILILFPSINSTIKSNKSNKWSDEMKWENQLMVGFIWQNK